MTPNEEDRLSASVVGPPLSRKVAGDGCFRSADIQRTGIANPAAQSVWRIHVEEDFEHLEHDEDFLANGRSVPTEYFLDASKSLLSENDSPDVPFRYSINPYRGCSHGCP